MRVEVHAEWPAAAPHLPAGHRPCPADRPAAGRPTLQEVPAMARQPARHPPGTDLKPLVGLPVELRRQHGVSIDYNRVYRSVLIGDVPATRIGGRLFYDPADVPAIA